ncbi:MAG: hypothetical protein AB1469_01125 [Pseudomonadota bacterium]
MESRTLITLAALGALLPAWAHAAPPAFPVCYNYGCSMRQDVTLSVAQWQEIRDVFTPPAASAQQERELVRRAVAKLEILTGAQTGAWRDRGGNAAGSGEPGQMDCIDESTNTTTYLTLLQQDGLLTWHDIGARARRSKWVLDVHWTAVLREKAGGRQYAVDSWFLDNGLPPYVQKLEDWLDKEDIDGSVP